MDRPTLFAIVGFVILFSIGIFSACVTDDGLGFPAPLKESAPGITVEQRDLEISYYPSYYQEGDTVRVIATFKNWSGGLVNVTNETFKAYNTTHALYETGTPTCNATGYYYYDYTLPYNKSPIYIEMSGTSDSTTMLTRTKFIVNFV